MEALNRKIDKIDERQRQLEIINSKMSLMIEFHENLLSETQARLKNLENRKADTIDRVWWIAVASIVGMLISETLQFLIR